MVVELRPDDIVKRTSKTDNGDTYEHYGKVFDVNRDHTGTPYLHIRNAREGSEGDSSVTYGLEEDEINGRTATIPQQLGENETIEKVDKAPKGTRWSYEK